MTFFKVDDGMWGHPKFSLLSNDAVALWVTAGSWCGRYLTDGLLPFQTLALVRGSKNAAQELVDAGLWLETPDGWLFHEWDHYQYTKDQVEERREYEREKKRRQRSRVPADVPPGQPGDSRGASLRDSLGSPGEGEGEGEGVGVLGVGGVGEGGKPDPFADFWSVYPRRQGKQAARKAWAKAVALADALDIIAGAERFRDDPNREPEFTPHPSTWLNAGRWEDDPLPPRGGQARSKADALMDWARSQDADSGPNAIGGYSDTPDDLSRLSVAPEGNHDDFNWEA